MKRGLVACTWTLWLLGLQLVAGAEREPSGIPTTVADGTRLGQRPLVLNGRIWTMRFTADGNTLLAAAKSIYRVDWRSKQAQPIWEQSDRETMDSAVFSPDGAQVARCENGKRIHLHECASGRLLLTLTGSSDRTFGAVAWRADGKALAIGGRGEILIHRTDSGELQQRILQGKSYIVALAWSADGKWLVAANRGDAPEDLVLLHSLQDGAPPLALPSKAHHSTNSRFSFTPDSTMLAVFGADSQSSESLYFWDVRSRTIVFRHERRDGYHGMAHSPDGKFFAACGSGILLVLDAHSGKEIISDRKEAINVHVWSLAFSPDGNLLAYAAEDRIRLLDTRTWKEVGPAEDLRAPVTALAFSADGRHLVTGGLNGDLLLWDWEKRSPVWKKLSTVSSRHIRGLSIDPSGRWIGVAQYPQRLENGRIHLVDLATGSQRKFLSVPNAYEVPPLFTPSGSSVWLLTAGQELVEWDFNEDRLLRKIPLPLPERAPESVQRLAYDPTTPGSILCDAQWARGRIDPDSLEQVTSHTPTKWPLKSGPIPPRSNEWVVAVDRLYLLPSHYEIKLVNWPSIPILKHPSGWLLFFGNHQGVDVFDLLSHSVIRRFSFGPGDMKTLALSPDGKTLVVSTSGGVFPVELHEKRQASPHITSEVLWDVMGSENHWEAYQAAWTLAQRADVLSLLKNRLQPARDPDPQLLDFLKTQLIDGNPMVRQAAARSWLDLGLTLDPKTYETLREGGIPVSVPSKFYHPEDYPFIAAHRGVAPIPALLPMAGFRRMMRALMILTENPQPDSLLQLQHLATGSPTAPLTLEAKKAAAIRSARANRQ